MEPPVLDKEMIDMLIDIMHISYLERMVGNVISSFYDLVIVGERVQSYLKSKDIQNASSSQASKAESLNNSQKEDVDEINAVMTNIGYSHGAPARPCDPSYFQQSLFPAPHYSYGQPTIPRASYHQPLIVIHSNRRDHDRGYQNRLRPQNNLKRKNAPLDPIPMTYNQLLPYLIQSSLVDPKSLNLLS